MSEILRKSALIDDQRTRRGRLSAESRFRGTSGWTEQTDEAKASSGKAPRRRGAALRPILMSLDAVAIFTAWLIVSSPTEARTSVLYAVVAAATGVIAIGMAGLYRARVCSVRSRELSRLVPVACITAIGPTFLTLSETGRTPIGSIVGACVLTLVFLIIERSGFDAWLRERRSQGDYCRPVAIIGTGREALHLYELFTDHAEIGYRVVGFYGPEPTQPLPDDAPWCGDVATLLEEQASSTISGVFVASDALQSSDWNWVVRELLEREMHVHFSGGPWGIDHRRLTSVPISYEPFFYLEPVSLARHQVLIKRTLDLVVATLGLIIMLPVMAVCAVVIMVQDGGSLLFQQKRVGKDGDLFTFYKLRTMVPDAESMLLDLTDANVRQGPLFKAENDPRVTRFGRFLRATSLDEVPQLFNVLRGDMSLVGPRPALPSEVAEFDDELTTRNRVRPGISGLWQVEARDNPSFSAYRRLDLFYAENWSTSLDIVILLLTAEQVLARVIRLVGGRSRPDGEDLAQS